MDADIKQAIININRNKQRMKRHHPTYVVWSNMVKRCTNPVHEAYGRYTLVKSWHKYDAFVRDMGLKPDGATLRRIDLSNNEYSRSNCEWVINP